MRSLIPLVLVATLAGCKKNAPVQSTPEVAVAPPEYHYSMYIHDDATSTTTIEEIRSNADTWRSREITGIVKVSSTPTDRGFWVHTDGTGELFALIVDQPEDAWPDINPGQTLKLRRAVVRGPDDLADIPGEPLTKDSVLIAQDEPAYLVVDETDLEILSDDPRAMHTMDEGAHHMDRDTAGEEPTTIKRHNEESDAAGTP